MGGEPLAGSGPGTHVKYGLAVCASLMLLAIAACSPPRPDYPVIGAKNFTEQVVLGEFIFRGVASVDNRLVLAGAIPAALLAIAADTGLGWVESRLRVPAPGRT